MNARTTILGAALFLTALTGCPAPAPCDAGACPSDQDAGGGEQSNDGGGADAGPRFACDDFVTALTPSPSPDGSWAAEATVDLGAAVDHATGTCVIGTGGHDVAFAFDVAGSGVLRVTATPEGSRDVALYLRAADCFAGSDVACVDRQFDGAAEALTARVNAGRYVLYVDAYSDSGDGAVQLGVAFQPESTPPANDTCASPLPLSFVDGVATVDGDTTFATAEPLSASGSPTCSTSAAATGRDLVYAFTVAAGETKDLSVTVTPHGALQPVLSVTSGTACAGTELACSNGDHLSLLALNEGTYFVWIDGSDDTAGAFTLSASLSDPPAPGGPDTCVGAVPVLASATTETVTGTTWGTVDDVTLGCANGHGKDVFYAFSTSQPQRFRAVATPTSPASFRVALGLMPASACGSGSDGGVALSGLAGCARGGGGGEPATLEVPELPAGDWLLVVDGQHDTFGTFRLDLALDAPAGAPSNDACASAAPLAVTATATAFGQTAEAFGSTFGAADDHPGSGTCTGAGPDVAFALPALQADDGGTVNVKASAWSLNALAGNPTVFLAAGCDGGTVACANGTANGAAVNAWNVASGTALSVWVDSAPDGGPFALEVDVATHAPSNDTCASPVTLPFSTTVLGSTLGATPDYMGFGGIGAFYAGPGCAQSLSGADVVYRFVSGDAGVYTVRLEPSRTFDPGLVVSSACAPGACVASTDDGLPGDEERISFAADAGTLYFVFVDSFSNDPAKGTARGSFGLSVEPP